MHSSSLVTTFLVLLPLWSPTVHTLSPAFCTTTVKTELPLSYLCKYCIYYVLGKHKSQIEQWIKPLVFFYDYDWSSKSVTIIYTSKCSSAIPCLKWVAPSLFRLDSLTVTLPAFRSWTADSQVCPIPIKLKWLRI